MAVTDKTDDALQGVNDFLMTVTDRITPNVVLMVSMINGFVLGLATTGFLGEKSLSVWSLSFGLILWQLVIICVFSSRYINLTTNYLNKFLLSAAMGYIWQWQLFGLWTNKFYPKMTTIDPPIENTVIMLMFAYLTVMVMFGYCFRGNEKNTSKTNIYSLEKEKKNVAS